MYVFHVNVCSNHISILYSLWYITTSS